MASKPFQLQHVQEFGLQIVERDPADMNVVTAVRCLFCVFLGREARAADSNSNNSSPAARPRAHRVQVWKKTFSPFLYKSHHDGQHANQWARYQASSTADKDTFFAGRQPIENDQPPNDGAVSGFSPSPHAIASALSARAVGSDGPVVKRPVGRPRADGSVPVQWSDEMAQRLMELRLTVFVNWFGEQKTASDFHNGWKLISTTLTGEFGVAVELEQCKNKFKMVSTRAQRRSSDQHELVNTSSSPQDVMLTTPRARRAPDTYKVDAPASVAVTGSANAPAKRGRGRPRKDASAPAPVKKQRVAAAPSDNQLDAIGNNINAVLLRKILRAVEEQKDALVAQKEALIAQKTATDAQTASVQELLQLLKTQGAPRPNF